MSIAEVDGPLSCFLDTSGTGESTKCPWVEAVENSAIMAKSENSILRFRGDILRFTT